MWGLLAVCLSNPDATFKAQMIGLGTILGFVLVSSLIVWSIIKAVIGIRVTEEQEHQGVDYSECGVEAYPEFTDSGKL
jgi:Amt family ammonium transporter